MGDNLKPDSDKIKLLIVQVEELKLESARHKNEADRYKRELEDVKRESIDSKSKLETTVSQLTKELEMSKSEAERYKDELEAQQQKLFNESLSAERAKGTGCLSFENLQTMNNDNFAQLNDHAAIHEGLSLDTLPWPPLNRLFTFLHTNGECKDLANLSMVSRHFRAGVKEFTKNNRPGLEYVFFRKSADGMRVSVCLLPSNIPFHEVTSLDSSRFTRGHHRDLPNLQVTLSGAEDFAVEKVADLLSAPIDEVTLRGSDLSSEDHSLCAQLLQYSSIKGLHVYGSVLNDNSVPSIISIASRAKSFTIYLHHVDADDQPLSDPGTFVKDLYSAAPSWVSIHHYESTSFFGLPNNFWTEFLHEKLQSGDIERVTATGRAGDERWSVHGSGPIDIPDVVSIDNISWKKVKNQQ